MKSNKVFCLTLSVLLLAILPLFSQNKQNKIVHLLEQNKLGKAERRINHTFKNDTASIDYLILKGRLERKKGNNFSAERYFKYCLQKDSLYSYAYAALGIVYYLEGDSRKGLNFINKAIDIDSTNMDFYNDRSAIYYEINMYEEAFNDLEKAFTKYPRDEYLIHNMGTALNALNRYEEAIRFLDIAQKINPKEPRNYFDRGIAYYYVDNPDKAITDLKKALRYNHRAIKSERIELYKIYYHLSLAYAEINDTIKSEQYYIKAVENGWVKPVNKP